MNPLNETDEAQMLAESYPLEWNGRTLKLSLINQNVKAKFNAACKANALAEFEELKSLFRTKDGKPDELRIAQEWTPIRDGLVSGQYVWGGNQATNFLKTTAGEKVFLAALLDEGGTPLSMDEINQMRQEKRAELLDLFQTIMMESEAPKVRRPAAKASVGQSPSLTSTLSS